MQTQLAPSEHRPARAYSGLGTRAHRGRALVVRADLLDMPGRERMRSRVRHCGHAPSLIGAAAASHSGAAFGGDFVTLAGTFSLTVRGAWYGHVGTSGTTGTGITAWANQSGTFGNMAVQGGAANGIGTITTGLNGHAGVATDGSTQRGQFTITAQGAPASTNIHRWWIGRQLAVPSGGAYIFNDGASQMACIVAGSQTSPAANVQQYGVGNGATTSGVVINQWYRGRVSYTGSSSDQIRIGAHAPSATITSAFTPTAVTRYWACSGAANMLSYELLAYLEIEGTLANFLSFDAVAGPDARSFWTSAIEI